MTSRDALAYIRGRWPDADVPAGEPEWILFEVSKARDAVLRIVEIFADGRIARNSIALEERSGSPCPSLIDCSTVVAFSEAPVTEMTRSEFEHFWCRGRDTPVWFGSKTET
ncbi:hypothetical protein [Methylobacterium mesophilicum]|uniref:hypothetical protein n=1 Tax=Methylobacterium mesophilicum TaxID=39956 RepID=UPI002F2CF0BB